MVILGGGAVSCERGTPFGTVSHERGTPVGAVSYAPVRGLVLGDVPREARHRRRVSPRQLSIRFWQGICGSILLYRGA